MVVSQKKGKKTSPGSSKFNSKLAQKKTWDAKRELVKKRLLGLTQEMDNEKASEEMDIPIICYKAKENTTNDPTNLPTSSKLKSKVTQNNAKSKLVKNRLIGLTQNMETVEVSEEVDNPIICYEAKENKTSGPTPTTCGSTSAVERAQEVRENLLPQFPSFSKLMLKSQVSGGFWLGLPSKFCQEYLPKHDATIFLVDENEQSYNTKYLVNKNGLSGGWKGFSVAHELADGDVLVFQLIEPYKFKVYVVRASKLTKVDGAISLLTLDFHAKPIDQEETEDQPEEATQISEKVIEKYQDPVLISDDDFATDQRGNASDNSCSDIIQGIEFSKSAINFKDVKKFEDFIIHVDGLILDSELPIHLRKEYYNLCCSQNMFLHENLIEGLHCDLATGAISETVNIADAIRAVNSTTPLKYVEKWDRTLKAFEGLGMVVGFLRDRINKIFSVYQESEAVIERKRIEKAEAEVEMRSLEEKLGNVGELVKRLDAEIGALTVKKEKELGFVLIEVASASW